MDELLAAAAQAMEIPVSMVERSAAARATADGVSVEDVLTAWAGGGQIVAAAPVPESSAEAPAVAVPDDAPAPAPAAPSAPMDEAAMVAAAAEKMGMPESMVRRSAAARAKTEGIAFDTVLMDWAGVDASTPRAAPSDVPAPNPVTAPASAATTSGATPASDDAAVLAAAAEKMGMPESMVKRSAAARAKAQGVDVDTVLLEWAGADAADSAPATTASSAAVATPAPDPTPAPAPAASDVQPEVEVLGGPEEAPPRTTDSSDLESEEEAAVAGAFPRWLAALFVLVPLFAIGYALFLPNGPNCGDAASLAIDPVTGLAVNCDGSDFGSEMVDVFALGTEVYNAAGCVACHGVGGSGVANFPAFTGGALLATFPSNSCSSQVSWIGLGTNGWPDPTYGATEKPVGGSGAVMPSFASTLSAEEISAVAVYERVAFGGQDLDAALVDCGAGAEGEPAALGE